MYLQFSFISEGSSTQKEKMLQSLMCLLLLAVLQIVASDYKMDCILKMDSCEYKLHLKPDTNNHGQCQNVQLWGEAHHTTSHRARRSDNSNNNDEDDSYKGATKFEKKILKSIDQLSVRMLRGVRRIERQVDDLVESLKLNKEKPPKKCPTGFISIDNWPSCYMFSSFDMSWYEAKDYCAAFDSDLVSLGTTREHFIVTYFIKNNKEYNDAAGWWTSGSFVSKTKQWMWTAQLFLKPFSFIKWAPGEPDEEAAQCMVVAGKDDHLWNDELCILRYNFVCEADARAL